MNIELFKRVAEISAGLTISMIDLKASPNELSIQLHKELDRHGLPYETSDEILESVVKAVREYEAEKLNS